MIDREIIDIALIVVGAGLIALGRNNSRSIKARDITNSTVIQGDVNINAAPAEQKPARGWVEWTGWIFGAAGCADYVLKLIRGG
jgi:hypothetical protein